MSKVCIFSEIFISLQGEGSYAGTQMLFLRTVGCNVGIKKNSDQVYATCESFTGEKFTCDTDYRKHITMTDEELSELIKTSNVKHVCVTGGEPFLHRDLIDYILQICNDNDKLLHIETSGTLPLEQVSNDIWITVSPKIGCLPSSYIRADEIKILVNEEFDVDSLPDEVISHEVVFLQPIAKLGERFPEENSKKCIELIKTHPSWRLSLQIQKLLKIL
jgi:organic radical activating enzyme